MINSIKEGGIILLIFVVIGNVLFSIILTISAIYNDTYFNEFKNIKSFENKELYMTNDFLLINSVYEDTGIDNKMSRFIVKGKLLSNYSPFKMIVNRREYLVSNLSKQPIYKSKLTTDYFLKDASEKYYNSEIRNFYFKIYLKFSFFIIVGFVIFLIVKHLRNRRYVI